MRKNIVAGNWKMNTNVQEGMELAKAVNEAVSKGINKPETGVIIAPPFTHLANISEQVDHNKVLLAAQNCSTQESGAYTGEVSVKMLKSIGVDAVILGHSERRTIFGEKNNDLWLKLQLVLNNNMKAIYCIGESEDERKSEIHFDVITKQVEEVLLKLDEKELKNVIVAYEPVWAIGTGLTASAEQAQEMHKHIRDLFAKKYGEKVADDVTILYGGSCKPSNAQELFSQPDVDGGLIGGASLKADDFMKIVNTF